MDFEFLQGEEISVEKLNDALNNSWINSTKLLEIILSNRHETAQVQVDKCIKLLISIVPQVAKNTLMKFCRDVNCDLHSVKLLLSYCHSRHISAARRKAVRCNNIRFIKVLVDNGSVTDASLLFIQLHSNSSYEIFAYLLTLPFSNKHEILCHLMFISRSDFVRKMLDFCDDITPYELSEALRFNVDFDIIERIVSVIDRVKAFQIACSMKNERLILQLMDVYSQAKYPLHHLVINENDCDIRRIIRKFVALGSDVDCRNNISITLYPRKSITDFTPLYAACTNSLTSSAIELLRLGAKFDPAIKYDKCTSQIQEALAVNFPEHFNSFSLNLNNVWMLNFKLREQIFTLMLCRQRADNVFHTLPRELMEYIFSYL